MTLDDLEAQGRVVITVAEVADVLGLSRRSAYRGVEDGSIPSVRIAGRIYVPVPRLRAMLGAGDN